MAIKKIIEVEIKDNITLTTDHVEGLNAEIQDTKKSVDDLSKSFDKNTDAVNKSFKPLKAQLREAQAAVAELAEKYGATSKEAIEAAKRAAELKDAIGDAKDLTDAFNPDAKFNALSKSIGGVLDGFSAFEGTLGLLGVESENVEKTLLKVQSAMALSQGLQGLMEAKDSFVQLGGVIKTQVISAFSSLKGAIISTGIGALAIALGYLIANFDKLKGSLSSSLTTAKKFETSTSEQAEAARNASDNFSEYERTLKRLGATEEEIYRKRKERFKDAIDKTEKEIEASKKVYKEQLNNLKTVKEFDKWGFNATGRLLFGDEEDAKKQQQKVKGLRNDLIKLKNDQFEYEKSITNKKKEEEEQRKKDALDKQKELNDKKRQKQKEDDEKRKSDELRAAEELSILQNQALQNRKKAENEFYDEYQSIIQQNADLTKTEQEKEIEAVNEKYFKLNELAIQYGEDTSVLEETRLNELNDINSKYAKEKSDLENTEREKKKELDKKAAEEEKQLQLQKLDAAKNTFTTIANLSELFAGKNREAQKRAFKIQKAANIANATIDTYKAATGAYSSMAGVPYVGPVLGAVAAGAAITAGLINVKNIASQQFEGGGSGGGGSVSAPSMNVEGGTQAQAPSFNIVGQGSVGSMTQLEQKPIQAFVVSGEVTSQQALDRNRLRNATL